MSVHSRNLLYAISCIIKGSDACVYVRPFLVAANSATSNIQSGALIVITIFSELLSYKTISFWSMFESPFLLHSTSPSIYNFNLTLTKTSDNGRFIIVCQKQVYTCSLHCTSVRNYEMCVKWRPSLSDSLCCIICLFLSSWKKDNESIWVREAGKKLKFYSRGGGVAKPFSDKKM